MPSILLVADAEWVHNDVEAALTEPGTALTVEPDPRAAAKLVASEKFDWALVDMQVGSMGGMAIVRMLRTAIASGSTDNMGIILLLDRSADEFLAGRAGADAALLKPFTAQELRARMAAVPGN